VFEDDDVLKLLHSRVKSAGGQSAFAKETGVERTYLNHVLKGKKPPGGAEHP
jgi:DNA-binding phage protein